MKIKLEFEIDTDDENDIQAIENVIEKLKEMLELMQ
jgi:hypothetical protein|tara:strand:+ start:4141 stop:4248 length:108 start_codon:yes stop_codon:yes gene_type:complete